MKDPVCPAKEVIPFLNPTDVTSLVLAATSCKNGLGLTDSFVPDKPPPSLFVVFPGGWGTIQEAPTQPKRSSSEGPG